VVGEAARAAHRKAASTRGRFRITEVEQFVEYGYPDAPREVDARLFEQGRETGAVNKRRELALFESVDGSDSALRAKVHA